MDDLSWVNELGHFYGTTKYYAWGPWNSRLTDGAEFLAKKAGCFWMFDEFEVMIRQHHAYHGVCFDNRFVVCTIDVDMDQYTATLTCDNGNGKMIAQKAIEFTDFPLAKFEVWAEYSYRLSGWVYMLPREH